MTGKIWCYLLCHPNFLYSLVRTTKTTCQPTEPLRYQGMTQTYHLSQNRTKLEILHLRHPKISGKKFLIIKYLSLLNHFTFGPINHTWTHFVEIVQRKIQHLLRKNCNHNNIYSNNSDLEDTWWKLISILDKNTTLSINFLFVLSTIIVKTAQRLLQVDIKFCNNLTTHTFNNGNSGLFLFSVFFLSKYLLCSVILCLVDVPIWPI